MSVSLTSNFLQNARGFTFEDSASVSWSINKSTNQLTASASGSVSSIGLADGSTAPIYTISGTPVTGSGTLTFTLKNQNANLVLAGPGTGSAAQPTFRSLVLADLPTGYLYSNLSGAPSIPAGANPSGTVGLAAVNGSATTFMRSDAAPALSVGIAPTWTGKHTWDFSSSAAISLVSSATGVFALEWGNGTITGGLFIGGASIQIGTISNHPLQFIVDNGGPSLSIATSGAVTVTSTFAINGGTPTAALSGFGSPSGSVTSGLSSSSTLAQTAGTLAALLAYLKTIGFIAA